jgi:hypothetical protein
MQGSGGSGLEVLGNDDRFYPDYEMFTRPLNPSGSAAQGAGLEVSTSSFQMEAQGSAHLIDSETDGDGGDTDFEGPHEEPRDQHQDESAAKSRKWLPGREKITDKRRRRENIRRSCKQIIERVKKQEGQTGGRAFYVFHCAQEDEPKSDEATSSRACRKEYFYANLTLHEIQRKCLMKSYVDHETQTDDPQQQDNTALPIANSVIITSRQTETQASSSSIDRAVSRPPLSTQISNLPGKAPGQLSVKKRPPTEGLVRNTCEVCKLVYQSKADKEAYVNLGPWISCDTKESTGCVGTAHAKCAGITKKGKNWTSKSIAAGKWICKECSWPTQELEESLDISYI